MNVALEIAISLSAGLVIVALVSLPSWLFASINRGSLWVLRDSIFDARRTGVLPDAPEVDRLLHRAEEFILVLPNITAAQLWWGARRHRSTPVATPSIFDLRLSEGGEHSRKLFDLFQFELSRALVRQHLLCSWSGLLFAAPRYRGMVRFAIRRRPFALRDVCFPPPPQYGPAVEVAADDPVSFTESPPPRMMVERVQEMVADKMRSVPRSDDMLANV